MQAEQTRQNKMGTAPMLPLIFSMSLPAMFSMLVQALYNIVDSYFVAQVSEKGLAAVSLAFPLQNLLIAFAVGTPAFGPGPAGRGKLRRSPRHFAGHLHLGAVCHLWRVLFHPLL